MTGEHYWYIGLPTGSSKSPVIVCRGITCALKEALKDDLFHGKVRVNSMLDYYKGKKINPNHPEGRYEVDNNGIPVPVVWVFIDDFLVHGPDEESCGRALIIVLKTLIQLGFLCNQAKLHVQRFCG
jgi:hypothetical protein